MGITIHPRTTKENLARLGAGVLLVAGGAFGTIKSHQLYVAALREKSAARSALQQEPINKWTQSAVDRYLRATDNDFDITVRSAPARYLSVATTLGGTLLACEATINQSLGWWRSRRLR